MSDVIENIELDENNVEFFNAAELVRHTDKLIYLTGKAGTGKTTFLKYIHKTTDKNTVILAPTGVAAINAGGSTIHSFFQIPLGPFVPDDSRLSTTSSNPENTDNIFKTFRYKKGKKELIENIELLIIDEISMVRADMLDVIDRILKVFRRKPSLPFGGVQVLLIGDTFQLSPISNREEWNILNQFYESSFFFSSRVIKQNAPIYIELKKVYRQNEKEFINLLNRIRVNVVTQNDLKILNDRYNPNFNGNGSDYIILATHNAIVQETNLTKLNELPRKLFSFEAFVSGDFPDRNKPTDHLLLLKVGAQIMFVKKDSTKEKRYFNGKIGKIKELDEDAITVVFDDHSKVEVERVTWNNMRYTYNKEKRKVEEEVIGTFHQFPIRLAWAITVHKSQGLTFEKVIADLGQAFTAGQVYVALSRCTSLSGLKLKSCIPSSAIITDPKVVEFAKKETPDTLITEYLKTGKADFYYKKARNQFIKGSFKSSLKYLNEALKIRNDMETESFQRFVVIRGSQLFSFKKKYSDSLIRLDLLEEELFNAKEKLNHQEQDISEKNLELEHQNSYIEQLLKNSHEFETNNKDLLNDVKKLNYELSQSKIKIRGLNFERKNIELELCHVERENELNREEINRLKGLSWIDKILGKK